jgi:hypothetical protein
MKATILLIAMFFIAQYGMAQIVTPNEEMLNDDLNFNHNEDIPKAEKKQVTATDKNNPSEREVASEELDNNVVAPKIKFWKY